MASSNAKQRRNIQVSSVSVWDDEEWTLDTGNDSRQPSKRKIRWKQDLGQHGLLTDGPHTRLLHTCKQLVYEAMTGGAPRGRLKGQSAVSLGIALLALVRWMVGRGILAFCGLKEDDVKAYRLYVATGNAWHSSKRRRGVDEPMQPAHQNTVYSRLQPLRYLVALRDKISDQPQWDPARDPSEMRSKRRSKKDPGIPAIPTDIAVPLLETAIRWVVEYGPAIVALQDVAVAAYRTRQGEVTSTHQHHLAAGRAIREAGTSVSVELRSGASNSQQWTKGTLSEMVQALVTACYIVIAGLTGMRVNEMVSLRTACIESRSIREGLSILVIGGRLIKTSQALMGEDETWVAGHDEPGNPIRLAVQIMEKLLADDRGASGLDHLFLCNTGNLKVPKGKPMRESVINERINAFARRFTRGPAWRYSTHQFRKTFARFVAIGNKVPLMALKRHFKHLSITTTLVYSGHDVELMALISEERQADMAAALHALLSADSLGGKMGSEITANNHRFRGQAGTDLRTDYVNMIMADTDLLIIPHEYGYCIFFADSANCGGERARVGISVCLGCSNLGIGVEHEPYWQRRRDGIDTMLEGADELGLSALQKMGLIAARDEAVDVLKKVSHGLAAA